MESSLRKTIIKLDNEIQLHYQRVTKYNKFGCKAIFYDPFSKTFYDVIVLSKGLLHLNNYKEQLQSNIKRYKYMNFKIICPIHTLTEDGDIIYIITQSEKYKLSELVAKRDGLTQFQALYFTLNIMEIVNYLKSRNCFFQIIEFDQIYLSSQMRTSIPFSLWITYFDNGKYVPIRHQDKKQSICPEVIENSKILTTIDQINSWNMGIFLYELLENKKPLTKQLHFTKNVSTEMQELIGKLVQIEPKKRLKYQLILIQSLFKKYKSLPHILPQTIFSCPPSTDYINEYESKFVEGVEESLNEEHEVQNKRPKCINIKTSLHLRESEGSFRNIKTFKYIKAEDCSLSESQSFIYDFVDISHVFGYGYQMSSGVICFVYNDRTSMYFEDQLKKIVFYVNEKKQLNEYPYEKLPEEGQIKKKLFILEAYTKSIKKFRQKPHSSEKIITANQFLRTNYASIFLLSNANIQVFFNDKISVLLTKNSIYIQAKNSDKFEHFQTILQTSEILVRKKYALSVANKFFHWDVTFLEQMRGRQTNYKNVSSRGEIQLKNSSNYWNQ